jgi:hypothetical protein
MFFIPRSLELRALHYVVNRPPRAAASFNEAASGKRDCRAVPEQQGNCPVTMAQWMGQFSGHTHGTKVGDIEESLRKAVIAIGATPGAVRHLAERLLAARLKLLRARIASAAELKYKEGRASSEQVPQLKSRARELEAHGVDGILKEFGAYEKILQ